jgi:hypothetical protein
VSKIDLKTRKFPTRHCRMICRKIYGREFSNSAWADWRKCVGVAKRAKWLTGDQLLRLSAIALIRRQSRKSLLLSEILQAEIEVASALNETIEALDRKAVSGSDVPQFLKDVQGFAPHQSTIYRKIPNFSKNKYYPPDYILKVA